MKAFGRLIKSLRQDIIKHKLAKPSLINLFSLIPGKAKFKLATHFPRVTFFSYLYLSTRNNKM